MSNPKYYQGTELKWSTEDVELISEQDGHTANPRANGASTHRYVRGQRVHRSDD